VHVEGFGEFSLEKFSSMGNAYTFSLQTLIFSAVVRAVLRVRGWEGSRWRVYGDDIIVPYRIYEDVVASLQLLGFKVNEAKSYSGDAFRESCGADYLNGTNVRPFYIKEPIEGVADLFKVLNLVQEFAARSPIPVRCYEGLYRLLLSWVPSKYYFVGNVTCGLDTCIRSPSIVGRRSVLRWHVRDRAVSPKKGYFAALYNGYRKFDPLEDVVVTDSGAEKYGNRFASIRKSSREDAVVRIDRSKYLDPVLLKD
jgi:hypothetical protein